jgi:hypothetical protein
MSIFSTYHPEHTPRVANGDYLVEIVDFSDKPTKKGDPMLTVTVRLNKVNLRVSEYFVAGTEFFNAKLTRFYECFGIEVGDQNPRTWIGAVGAVALKEDGEYMRISRMYPKDHENAKKLEWEGPMPERQTINSLPSGEVFGGPAADDDELPF